MTVLNDYTPRDWESHPPYRYEPYKSTVLRGPTKPLMPLPQTLSELTGPVYGHEAVEPLDQDFSTNDSQGITAEMPEYDIVEPEDPPPSQLEVDSSAIESDIRADDSMAQQQSPHIPRRYGRLFSELRRRQHSQQ